VKKQIVLWVSGILLFGAIVFGLGRLSLGEPAPTGVLPYSLSPGVTGMVGGGNSTYEFATSSSVAIEDVKASVQRYLDQEGNPDLALARLREFTWAYEAEVVERSTGRHAFGLMVSKATTQVSPKAGPNLFWNTKYGSMIAEVGGGYGMVGRLLPDMFADKMSLSESRAQTIAEGAVKQLDAGLTLGDKTAVFYGFYEFNVLRDGKPVGELDVNGYSGQVWHKDWGEPQRGVQDLIP